MDAPLEVLGKPPPNESFVFNENINFLGEEVKFSHSAVQWRHLPIAYDLTFTEKEKNKFFY